MQKNILILAICSFIFSCSKKYIRTEKVCDQKLYLEVYERRQLGVSYLTDSVNFRIYVTQLNFENEDYLYRCTLDSVLIFLSSHDFSTNKDSIIAEFKYNIRELQKGKTFEK